MPIDLTDFTQIPRQAYYPKDEPVRKVPSYIENKMTPIDPATVDSEMYETLEKEGRRDETFKKTHWSINDFAGVPYNAADAARMRKERGMEEPDKMIKASEHLD